MKLARVFYTLGKRVSYPVKEQFFSSGQTKISHEKLINKIPNILESGDNTAC